MDLPRINHENIQDIFIKSFVFQKYYIKKKNYWDLTILYSSFINTI